jgi:hypothetical protein
VLLKALAAKRAATVLPMLPLVATFELVQTSYGAPELFSPGVSTRISMLTSLRYSGTPKKPAAKFSAVLTMRSCDCVRKTGIVLEVVKLLRRWPYIWRYDTPSKKFWLLPNGVSSSAPSLYVHSLMKERSPEKDRPVFVALATF